MIVRSTVIMKTDIRGFTTRVGMLSTSDLSTLLRKHKKLILDIAAKYEGSMVKGEGDSFWIIFPSVLSASLAATAMQEGLRDTQAGKNEDSRLALRIAITLGDILHQENDIFGDAVNLAARIESVTPPDDIYLSHAAWLALNRAEVQTSFVNEFTLKGFSQPVKIYKIPREYKTRTIKDQIIVFTDIRHFAAFNAKASIKEVEELLIHHENFHNQICEEFAGIIRMIYGDAYFLTFTDAKMAISGLNRLGVMWDKLLDKKNWTGKVPISMGVHRGDLNIFRSSIFGEEINTAARVEGLAGKLSDPTVNCLFISSIVMSELIGTEWENRLKEVDLTKDNPFIEKGISVFYLEKFF